MKVREVIDRSLGKLGVLGEGELSNDHQLALGMSMLDDMFAKMAGDDINLQALYADDEDVEWSAQTDADAEIQCPSWAWMGVTSMLAAYSADAYGAAISPSLSASASEGYQAILRKVVKGQIEESSMVHLPLGQGRTSGVDITTDGQ